MQLRDALLISLDYENKVRDHYLKGLELITDPVGKRIFDTLAREEQGHVDFLKSRLDRLEHPELPMPEVMVFVPEEWIVKAKQRIERPPSGTMASQTDIELVKLALQMEHETSNFYHGLMDKLKGDDRRVFEPFLNIEDGHIAVVQAELDSLQGLGFWFDFQEFSLEAG